MSEPIALASATPRFSLPLLFAGQAQKEFFVNEAHLRLDQLLHPAVEGELAAPPSAPLEGECWIVSATAMGAWVGREGCLASYGAAGWRFADPRDGMLVFDRNRASYLHYRSGWNSAAAPQGPDGGATIDSEARSAIIELIAVLRALGILS